QAPLRPLESAPVTLVRTELVRRGQGLTYATLALNSLEAIVALAAGLAAGSVALLGFGVDSLIELTAGVTALWRLAADFDPARRARVEKTSLRIVGACFLALAAYVAYEAGRSLVLQERPAHSLPGIALAVLSLVSMPLLARAKRRVAAGMSRGALAADARQTALCGYCWPLGRREEPMPRTGPQAWPARLPRKRRRQGRRNRVARRRRSVCRPVRGSARRWVSAAR